MIIHRLCLYLLKWVTRWHQKICHFTVVKGHISISGTVCRGSSLWTLITMKIDHWSLHSIFYFLIMQGLIFSSKIFLFPRQKTIGDLTIHICGIDPYSQTWLFDKVCKARENFPKFILISSIILYLCTEQQLVFSIYQFA